MSEVPLYSVCRRGEGTPHPAPHLTVSHDAGLILKLASTLASRFVQGYLAHGKTPPPPGCEFPATPASSESALDAS